MVRNLPLFMLLWATTLFAAPKTIAFAQDDMANDYRKAQVFETRDAAQKAGLRFEYTDAGARTALFIRQIDRFAARRVDLLVIGTGDADAVVPAVAKAYHGGIPVIILDRGINGTEYTTFINSDNVRIGAMGAGYIAERLQGKGRVLLFEGLQKADVTHLRSRGFLNVMAGYPQISVIKRTGNYLRKDAIFAMEKLLDDGEQVDAIFSESDSMLSGVRSVLNRRGIDPASLITVGCDYTSEARDAIRAGTQSASVLFPLGGRQTVEVALRIFRGETAPKHITIPVRLVTRANVETVEPVF